MRVSEMQPTDRPAERLGALGPKVLNNVELLSIILGSGNLEKTNAMMRSADGLLRSLAQKSATELNATPREWRAIQASIEFARRWSEETQDKRIKVGAPRDVANYAFPRMADLLVEEFHVLILDSQNCIVRDVMVTKGILNSSLVHPREVFREAIKEAAAAVILLHNHPSGDSTPSADDRAVTEQLAAAGRVLDIPVYDHVIVGHTSYFSFSEAGIL